MPGFPPDPISSKPEATVTLYVPNAPIQVYLSNTASRDAWTGRFLPGFMVGLGCGHISFYDMTYRRWLQ